MIGAEPNTDWLDGCLDLDAKGFIQTGKDADGMTLASPYATTKPGIFAVGDVRSGSVKRVASGRRRGLGRDPGRSPVPQPRRGLNWRTRTAFCRTLVPVILLLTLGVIAAVASRAVGLSPIVGYLVLGLALSGVGLDLVADSTMIATLAELGVVFLLFDIGLHFSLGHIREQARDIFGFGPVQVLAGTLALGLFGLLFGLPPVAAFLVGATLALSSTAVVAGLIAERHQQNCPVGLTATAILIFQDVAAIFLLIVASALGTGEALAPAMGVALLKAAVPSGSRCCSPVWWSGRCSA